MRITTSPLARITSVLLLCLVWSATGVMAQVTQVDDELPLPSGAPYYGHRVVSVEVQDMGDVERVLKIADAVWRYPRDNQMEIRVSPGQLAELERTGLAFTVLIEDVGDRVDAEAAEILRRRAIPTLSWFENYQPLWQIENKIASWVAAYPTLIQDNVIGQSIEGRDIHMLTVSAAGAGIGLPAILITGCQHAREWVSPMTVMYIVEQLLENYATDPRMQYILTHRRLYIAPMVNPDGYDFSWSYRDWRKNRNPNNGHSCKGVDLNRNWSYEWGGVGASGDPCSESYHGVAPFSEPETQCVSNFALAHSDEIEAFIDFHSYDQSIVSPWSHTEDSPPSESFFNELGQLMSEAIHGVHGETYEYGPGGQVLWYRCSGTAKDWGFGTLGALTWTIELRPERYSEDAFELPPEEILPTCQENFEAVLQLAERLLPPNTIWVDFDHGGFEFGTFRYPYNTLAEGVSAVISGGTVVAKAGTTDESPTLSKAHRLRSFQGTAVIGTANALAVH